LQAGHQVALAMELAVLVTAAVVLAVYAQLLEHLVVVAVRRLH
jgi:hypothetical protein